MFDAAKDENKAYDQFARGLAYRRRGMYEQALVCFDKALKLTPENLDAWYSKARTYILAGQLEEGRWCLEHTLSLCPGYYKARKRLNNLLATMPSQSSQSSQPAE